MKYRSIDWADIKEYYKKYDIKAINFSILDMNADDMSMKAFDAATFLNELITKYKVSKKLISQISESLRPLYSRYR